METNAIHEVDTICPICSKVSVLGHTDMTGQDIKHICPRCKTRHYGKPITVRGLFKCGKCGLRSKKRLWEKIPLENGEHVLGPIDWCSECIRKTKDDKVAFIEIENGTKGETGRTGRVFFFKPDEAFLKLLKGQNAVYIEESVLRKMMAKNAG